MLSPRSCLAPPLSVPLSKNPPPPPARTCRRLLALLARCLGDPPSIYRTSVVSRFPASWYCCYNHTHGILLPPCVLKLVSWASFKILTILPPPHAQVKRRGEWCSIHSIHSIPTLGGIPLCKADKIPKSHPVEYNMQEHWLTRSCATARFIKQLFDMEASTRILG